MVPPWFYDIGVLDERLTKVEDKVERILELIEGISSDLNGGGGVKVKSSPSKGKTNRTKPKSNK